MDTRIIELMAIPKSDHDLDWLKESLQSAVKLEFATLPPYLCALWSIKDESDPSYLSIRQHIAEEEMLHMGLACNLLTAIGGVPIMNTPETIPEYPTNQLPGGIPLNDTLVLRALSKDALKVFLEIEYPEFGPIAKAAEETFPTIGDFYDAIQEAFDTLQPEISEENQLGGFLGLFKIKSLETVKRAIDLIKIQGEGTPISPEEQPGDPSHYYRFGEIYYGKKLIQNGETGEWGFNGAEIPFPDVWPMSLVPVGGYEQADVSSDVWEKLVESDQLFTTMINQIQSAWENGDSSSLSQAVGTMFQLKGPALELMQTPIPTQEGNYGPCFRLV